MVRRGEIFYIENSKNYVGCEQKSARPAVIVSNDKCNTHSSVFEVVFLTTQEKKELPTHVDIFSTGRRSTALCEQIHSISTERIGDYCGICSEDEMKAIDNALMISLGIDFKEGDNSAPVSVTDAAPPEVQHDDYHKLTIECELYKKLYEQLLERMMK